MRSHRVRRTVVLWSAAGFLVCLSTRIAVADEAPRQPVLAAKAPAATAAAQLVRAALESEAAGQLDERAARLHEALAADPNYAAAHWHLGQVLVDKQWLSVAEGTESNGLVENRQARHLEQYRKLRQTMASTLEDHIRVARFCREAGLVNQERLHLSMVLRFDRSNKEAITRLRTPKRLADPKEAARQAAAIADAKRIRTETYARWKDQLTRLRDDLASNDAQRREAAKAQLLAIGDVEAIPALEATVSGSSRDAARLVVSILEKMPSAPATVSLAKHAVLSEWPEVREKAALALKPRDLFAYAPPLLAHMAMPVEIDFDIGSRYGGAVGQRLELFQEGPEADRSFLSMNIYTPEPVPTPPGSVRNGANTTPPTSGSLELRARVALSRPPVEQSATRSAAIASSVERYNERAKQLNQRIAYVLRTATGVNLPDVPTQWWTWWYDYNDIYYSGSKPVHESGYYEQQPYAYVETSVQSTPATSAPTASAPGPSSPTFSSPAAFQSPQFAQRTPPPRPLPPGDIRRLRAYSCFIAGTPVWTQSGPMPIEKVLVGENVLAQDVRTGELGYRPVVATTVRPPLPTLAVKIDDEEILVSRGHPFWVSGTGWRMAKELKEGDPLHTPGGALAIDGIDERADYPTYNLVVAGFNSYFVGKSQVLVHDNNIRGATPTVVPGLLP